MNIRELAVTLLVGGGLCLYPKLVKAQTTFPITPSTTDIEQLEQNEISPDNTAPDIPKLEDEPALTDEPVSTDEQKQILLQALEVAQTIEDPQQKATVLSDIASLYANMGEFSTAFSILSEATDVANNIQAPAAKATVMGSIALKYAAIDRPTIASDTLDSALEIANTIEDEELRASVLTDIALKYNNLGQYSRSLALLSQSEEIAQKANEPLPLFPFQPIPWTGSFTLGANLFSGRKTTSRIDLLFDLERKWARDQFDLGLTFNNQFDDSRTGDDENRIRAQVEGEYRHHYTERWQYFVNTAARRDDVNDIDIRTSLYTGPGINIWRAGPSETLDMQLGLGVRFEDSTRRDEDFDVPVAQYRLRYKDIFFGNWKLRQFFTFELPLVDTADYYLSSSTSIAIPISARWSFRNFLKLRYAARPTLNNPNLEVDFITGINYTF